MSQGERRRLFSGWMQELDRGPLEPGDERYVELKPPGKSAIDEIRAGIELSTGATAQLISGPRGSGKTTELKRLKLDLEQQGFTVLLVDALRYVNPSTRIEITEFLIAIALAFGDELAEDDERGFTTRLLDFAKRLEVSVAFKGVEVEVAKDALAVKVPGFGVGVRLREELVSNEAFLKELREELDFHLGQLLQEVKSYCAETVARHLELHPDSAGVVMIVDSLEKARGARGPGDEVQHSLERLFVQHSEKLRFPSHHMVYTVPPYLALIDPAFAVHYGGTVRLVPVPAVFERKCGQLVGGTVELLEQVVRHRVPWDEFGESRELLVALISASGGHLSDLLMLVGEVAKLAYARGSQLPVGREEVEDGIANVARTFGSFTAEGANLMRGVESARGGVYEPTLTEVDLLAQLLDSHAVLCHMNHVQWYEVHPLALEPIGAERSWRSRNEPVPAPAPAPE